MKQLARMLVVVAAGCSTAALPRLTELMGAGASFALQPYYFGEPFSSPFGPLSRRAAYNMCLESPNVKIGTVDAVRTFYRNDYDPSGRVVAARLHSELLFVLDRNMRGSVGTHWDEFTLVVPGGLDDETGLFERTPAEFPQPFVGGRYAVGFSSMPNPTHGPREWPNGMNRYIVGFSVAPGGLPSEQTLQEKLEEFCGKLPSVP